MNFLRNNRWLLIGTILGAVAGYAYFHFVGCNSGTCAITSKPLNSTLYGSVMGALLFSSFKN
ncbi:hypothetical protein SAMN06298216_0223 [Spirosomataceae bacterium TFI 002]|nr:hypothetical protein SAMN06298216_0223 [Spirosomataceae bacterium TFI 002]